MKDMVNANDPSLQSWLEVKPESDFPIQNLPFGVFKTVRMEERVCSAIGDFVIDLTVLAEEGFFDVLDLDTSVFYENYLNPFMALGKAAARSVRNRLAELLSTGSDELKVRKDIHRQVLVPMNQVQMMMPVKIGDYTDFYSSIEHATNVGTMFRDPNNALLPNWRHLPVGYHGRASSIIVSGTPIHRPKGQFKAPDAELPSFGPSQRLDFELEMAFVTCKPTRLGESISTEDAEDYIFGFVLFNDWSARDIQQWEYVPLGPFLGKNFGSSISPWIVTLDALEPFRVEGPKQEPEVLPYLQVAGKKNFDIELEVYIQPEGVEAHKVCHSNFKYMYWNINQQLAHHTVNGCNINVGDMYASGTISGSTPDSFGSMLELAWKGTKPLQMPDGSERKFILDGDTVIMKGYAMNNGVRIGFGEVRTKVLN
jgi:fumarylacetoacetase